MADVTFKRATVHDVDKLGRLSDTVFRSTLQPGTGMPKEFPIAFSAENAQNLYFAEVGDVPVSLVAIQPGRLWVNGSAVSAISMGSVCTLPEYRKHHYVSELIQQVLADFSPSTSVLLVSGGLSIYRKIGCVDFGVRTAWTVNHDWMARYAPSDTKVVPFDSDAHSFDALTTLYQAEDYHFERTTAEFRAFVESLTVPLFHARPLPPRVFVAVEDGQVTSYAIAHAVWRDGKGHVDVLEWAGRRADWVDLAATLLQWYHAETLTLLAQSDDTALRDTLATCSATAEETPNQGTIRVLNANTLTEELAAPIQSRCGATLSLVEVEPEVWMPNWSPVITQNGLGDGGFDGSNGADVRGQSTGSSDEVATAGLPQARIEGYAALGEWFFGSTGLGIQLPHTDDLNYV